MLGRLGNQMFIYAFVRRLTLDLGLDANLIVDPKENRLTCFKLSSKVHFVTSSDYSLRQNLGIFLYRLMTCGNKPISKITQIEKRYQFLFHHFNLHYSQEGCLVPSSRFDNLAVLGYFQSETCFLSCKNVVLKEFTFKSEIQSRCEKLKDEMNEVESCCVHIRMGDYLNSDIFGVCGIDYYGRAMKLMRQNKPQIKFFIFSDSIEDVKSSFDWSDCSVSFISETFSDQESMYLGSQCKHYILSNSTFSWWMQYLSKNTGKVVIAPSRWFNQDRPCHIYQNNWTLIEP